MRGGFRGNMRRGGNFRGGRGGRGNFEGGERRPPRRYDD